MKIDTDVAIDQNASVVRRIIPDHGRLFINEARTGVMAWWSMGRWTDRAAREAIIAPAMTMTLADFRRWFARHAASCLVD
jgi:hypothetical protein